MTKTRVSIKRWPQDQRAEPKKIEALTGAENLAFYRWSTPPGNVYGAHHHTHDKVIYVVTGSTALSHTVVTSGTALLVLLALLDLGEILLRDFALALLIGVVVGTNSSIFVAGPIVFVWETWSGRNRR